MSNPKHSDILTAVDVLTTIGAFLDKPPKFVADLYGRLTDEEKQAWTAADGVLRLVDAYAPDSDEKTIASTILRALMNIGQDIHRFIVAGRKIEVKAAEAQVRIGRLGEGVQFVEVE